MAKKILLAGGCSWTDQKYISLDDSLPDNMRGGWPMWPEIVAKNLNLSCINTGKSGMGSDYILNKIYENILKYKNKIEIVAITWSSADRFCIYGNSLSIIPTALFDDYISKTEYRKFVAKINFEYYNSGFLNFENMYKGFIDQHFQKMCIIIDMCKFYNIKLIMAQGLHILNSGPTIEAANKNLIPKNAKFDNETLLKYILNSPYFEYLENNKKNIIGWPFKHVLGGYPINYLLLDKNFQKPIHRISNKDFHPNSTGQEIIAHEFLKKYEKLYG